MRSSSNSAASTVFRSLNLMGLTFAATSCSALSAVPPAPAPISSSASVPPVAAGIAAAAGTIAAEAGLPRLGQNLNGPADWNTELPFVNIFKLSRAWISQQQGKSWGQGPQLDIDENGYVKALQPDCFAETLINTGAHYPAGQYTLLYDGTGKFDFNGDAKKVSEAPGRVVFEAKASGGFFVRLMATDPANYARNIRVLPPGLETVAATQTFRAGFLDTWRGVSVLRFMDWQKTNGSPQQKWPDRPHPDQANYTGEGGIPIEVMVDLCNQLHADAWFCVPHLADDDYVRNFATLVKTRLAPDRHVYLEYSNELWNGGFSQSRWAGKKGQDLGLAEKPWEAGWLYTARRSVEIFEIWDQVFGGRAAASKRLVRVLASQSANSYVARQITGYHEAYKHADALAIAPYMTFCIPEQGTGLTAAEVSGWTVDQVLNQMENKALPESLKWTQDNKLVADQLGLRLIAYEAGQHAVGIQGGENNAKLTALLQAANKTDRMGRIYAKYLQGWEAAGGGLLCNFSSIGSWSKWGSWGVMQYADDNPADYPKFVAVLKWAQAKGQPVKIASQ